MAGKTIVVLATLDTKGREAEYLREQIEKFGDAALVIDTGVVGSAGVPAGHHARRSGRGRGHVAGARSWRTRTRDVAAPVMADGAIAIVNRLAAEGKVHGIVSMGGTQGTTLSTQVMRALPYGFPKVMVSTMASGNVGPWVDIKDITMMFSVTDILGLNPVTRKILANAAGAVCGMAAVDVKLEARGEAAGRRDHGRHHHAGGDEGDRGAGGRRLRDDRVPRDRARRPGDGADDARRASSARCWTSRPSRSRTRCTTRCWPAAPSA